MLRRRQRMGDRPVANHKSAIKRHRQSLKRRQRNRHARNGMRTVIKSFRAAVEAGDADAASAGFTAAESAIRRAASKGIIPRRRADRHVGRLAKSLNSLSNA